MPVPVRDTLVKGLPGISADSNGGASAQTWVPKGVPPSVGGGVSLAMVTTNGVWWFMGMDAAGGAIHRDVLGSA